MEDAESFRRWLHGATPYLRDHRDRTFVVLVGAGALAADLEGHLTDVAALTHLGIRVVVVHASPADDAPPEAGIDAALADLARTQARIEAILGRFQSASRAGRSHTLVTTGNFIMTQPVGVIDGVERPFQGRVRRINAAAIRAQLELGALVLLSGRGASPTGEPFLVAPAHLAQTVALALKADKLIVIDSSPVTRDGAGRRVPELTPGALDIALAEVPEPARAPLIALRNAVRGGIGRGHLIEPDLPGALLTELFTADGAGTQIADDPGEHMRPAGIDDIPAIIELIRPLEQAGILVRRTQAHLETEIEHFRVIDLDGLVIACAALVPLDATSAEIACVAVDPDYRQRRAGDRLLRLLEAEATRAGLHTLFVLTTQTEQWFEERGYRRCPPERLPTTRGYDSRRKARVLQKRIDP